VRCLLTSIDAESVRENARLFSEIQHLTAAIVPINPHRPCSSARAGDRGLVLR
jgi:hypothetical protein